LDFKRGQTLISPTRSPFLFPSGEALVEATDELLVPTSPIARSSGNETSNAVSRRRAIPYKVVERSRKTEYVLMKFDSQRSVFLDGMANLEMRNSFCSHSRGGLEPIIFYFLSLFLF